MKSLSRLIKVSKNQNQGVLTWTPVNFTTPIIEEEPAEEGFQSEQFISSLATVKKTKEIVISDLVETHKEAKNTLIRAEMNVIGVSVWNPVEFMVEMDENKPEESHGQYVDLEEHKQALVEIEKKVLESHKLAEEIVSSAQKQAQQIIKEAEQHKEQVYQAAYQEGIVKGQAEAVEVLNSAAAVVKETQAWRERMLKDSESNLIEMLQIISKKLFGTGFVLEPSMVEQMVARAISEASRLGNLRVYLNPADEKSLISLWQDSELTVNGQKIQLVPSQNIVRGGCFVEGEFGSVDGRVDVQLDLIQEQLSRTLNDREEEIDE